jgi:uncharacterized damage-inducible protein DinB
MLRLRWLPTLAVAALAAAPAAGQSYQAQVANDVRAVGQKFVSLAQAMPAEDYGWRPEEGVRSVSEVYMHIAGANMGLPFNFMQVAPPEGYTQDWFGSAEQITDKDEVVRHLQTAFDHMADVIEGLTDEQLMQPVNVFGNDTNWMGAVMLLQTHAHEHLGQSIAYARTNGVTPPWSG